MRLLRPTPATTSKLKQPLMGEHPPSASIIRRIPCKVDPNPASGSFNLIFFINFDDGEIWVLKISGNGHSRCWDEFAAGALESEALTMRWIKGKTTIPVPEVYGFDSSMDNAIGCPYIMMEYIKGKSLYGGWFDPQASPARLEQFRARALQTIAAAMVQLHNIRFHTSGSLRVGPDGKPYKFQAAKVVDFTGMAAGPQDNTNRDISFAQKGPFKDPHGLSDIQSQSRRLDVRRQCSRGRSPRISSTVHPMDVGTGTS